MNDNSQRSAEMLLRHFSGLMDSQAADTQELFDSFLPIQDFVKAVVDTLGGDSGALGRFLSTWLDSIDWLNVENWAFEVPGLDMLQRVVNQVMDILNGLIVTPINNAVAGIKDWFAGLLGWRNNTDTAIAATDGKAGDAKSLAEAAQAISSQIASNINALGKGSAVGEGPVADIWGTIADLIFRASDAQQRASDAQSTLQGLLNRDEAEQSGGNSGGDDFNRDNAASLGSNWAQTIFGHASANVIVEGNAAVAAHGGGNVPDTWIYNRWVGSVRPATDFHQVTFIGTGRFGNLGDPHNSVLGRWDGAFVGNSPRNAVMLTYSKSQNLTLTKFINGVQTVIAQRKITINSGDRLQLRCGTMSSDKQFQALVNGSAVLTVTDNTTLMGEGYRETGMVHFISNSFGIGHLPAAIADWSFSDIPGAGSISGNGFRVYRTSATAVSVSAASQVPSGFFDNADIAPNLNANLSDRGRGVFTIPKSGWWDIEFKVDGQKTSTTQGTWVVDMRLYYGANLEFNTLIGKPAYVKTADNSSTYQIPGGLESRCRRYFPAGYKIAPGFGVDCDITQVIAEASGSMVSFSAVLLS
ncbi:minor tail protein [Gordonia phage Bantam]|uniref:Minor tail protein n=1 Tax=Gordonia phage Bantam TaxID=1887641 RepID=A0A1B3AY98_9CAUD|nr:tail protein [Gordonia phage Bantam]AOE43727.1 minor tail protein [Gordonia phage Bantam]